MRRKRTAKSDIGYVIAAGAIVNFLMVVYGGRLSDFVGRKGLFGGSQIVFGAANAAMPFLPQIGWMTALKMTKSASSAVRGSLRSVLVFESVWAERFARMFGRLAGLETTANAVGYGMMAFIIIVLVLMVTVGYLFLIAAVCLVLAGTVFLVFYREPPVPAKGEVIRLGLRDVFRFDLHRKMYVVIGAQGLFNVGTGISHTLWVVYLVNKLKGPWNPTLVEFQNWLGTYWHTLDAPEPKKTALMAAAIVSLVAAVHKIVGGTSMTLFAPLLKGHFKALFIGFLLTRGWW